MCNLTCMKLYKKVFLYHFKLKMYVIRSVWLYDLDRMCVTQLKTLNFNVETRYRCLPNEDPIALFMKAWITCPCHYIIGTLMCRVRWVPDYVYDWNRPNVKLNARCLPIPLSISHTELSFFAVSLSLNLC